ncbi:LytTR family DNA-binding domain-containing protein [Flavobacterium sp.]|uniref:LytR/AlgR family response regulator transcription factor n=1 Tax=Flavobacterium sp. TaxID=239 RepID=UPI002603B249|nr:LytTR family DNA-binding domain-containing protein [Flavobacterium sp.]
MDVVIIEDEMLTCRDLERTLKSVDSTINIVAYLHSVAQSRAFFEQGNISYDLIISDIELGDGQIFTVYDEFTPTVPVIFCTAYNEYALKAFGCFGIDYLLKPFSVDTVGASLQKYKLLEKKFLPAGVPEFHDFIKEMLVPQTKKVTSIIIHKGDKLIPYLFTDIALFFKEEAHLYAVTFSKEQLLVSNNLERTEAIAGPLFFRVNRQMLVNRTAVKDLNHHFNRKLLINLTIPCNRQVLVPKEKTTAFIEWLTLN